MKIYAVNSVYASANIGVRPIKTLWDEFDVNVPSPCTATDPVFIFSHAVDPTHYNLFYAPAIGKRFYNVTNVVYREGGMYEYHCHVNLLLSMLREWKNADGTRTTTTLCERSNVTALLTGDDVSESFDAKLHPVMSRKVIYDTSEWGCYDESMTYKDSINTMHYVSHFLTRHKGDNHRAILIGYVSAASGYRVAIMRDDIFAILLSNLNSTALNGITDQSLAKFYGSPADCVKMCKVLPCRWADIQEFAAAQSLETVTSLTLGYYTIGGLTNVYIVPVNNPEMVLRFTAYSRHPVNPAYALTGEKCLQRSPHTQLFVTFPPFGTVEIDTEGEALPNPEYYYTIGLMVEIDLLSCEATLYYRVPIGTEVTTNWTLSQPWKIAAKSQLAIDLPIAQLTQNISAIRSAELGLAKLDTQRSLPNAQISQFIASSVNNVYNEIVSSRKDATAAQYNGEGFLDRLMQFEAMAGTGAPIANTLFGNAGKVNPYVSPENSIVSGMQKAVSAMDTTFSFSIETNAYKTQISDATRFPQMSITGNASGSMSYANLYTGRFNLYTIYEEYAPTAFNTGIVGHECCKTVSHMAQYSNTGTEPVNKCSIVTASVFVRGLDEGQLTDSERTELRTILNTGFTFQIVDDEWMVISE